MVIKQNNFQALCKCNTFTDFGNHTGFKWVERTYKHLLVGEWYNFVKHDDYNKYNILKVVIDGETNIGNGYDFWVGDGENHINDHVNFYHFFSTLEESRELKLKVILE